MFNKHVYTFKVNISWLLKHLFKYASFIFVIRLTCNIKSLVYDV